MSSFWLDESTAKRYNVRRAFTYDGIQYTSAGATAETFAGLGFVEVLIDQRPDDNFYIVSGPDDSGAYNSTPRDHTQMVEAYIKKEADSCKAMLAHSDWMVVRKSETGVELPADWSTYREECRATCDLRQQQLAGTADTAELEALVKEPAEIYDDVTRSSIENPEPHLTPWPLDPDAVAAAEEAAAA